MVWGFGTFGCRHPTIACYGKSGHGWPSNLPSKSVTFSTCHPNKGCCTGCGIHKEFPEDGGMASYLGSLRQHTSWKHYRAEHHGVTHWDRSKSISCNGSRTRLEKRRPKLSEMYTWNVRTPYARILKKVSAATVPAVMKQGSCEGQGNNSGCSAAHNTPS